MRTGYSDEATANTVSFSDRNVVSYGNQNWDIAAIRVKPSSQAGGIFFAMNFVDNDPILYGQKYSGTLASYALPYQTRLCYSGRNTVKNAKYVWGETCGPLKGKSLSSVSSNSSTVDNTYSIRGMTICGGDSGGPVYINNYNNSGKAALAGIMIATSGPRSVKDDKWTEYVVEDKAYKFACSKPGDSTSYELFVPIHVLLDKFEFSGPNIIKTP